MPVGPKRSVRICSGGYPTDSSIWLIDSTKGFEPQTKASPDPYASAAIRPGKMRPSWKRGSPSTGALELAGERDERVLAELVGVDHVGAGAGRVEEAHRQLGHREAAVAQHRHQRHDARAAADQQHRLLAAPDEVGGERAADLDLVALHEDVVEVGRDLAVVEAVDRQLDRALVERRGGDRVGALGPVAVGRGEAHVVVLARQMRHPHRRAQPEGLGPRRLDPDLLDVGDLPAARGALRDRGQSVQYRCSFHGSPWLL